MSKSRITLRVVLMMCCATLLTLVMVIGTLFWFARQSDHRAQHAAHMVISESLVMADAQLRADAQGFASWPQASRAATAQDTSWLTGKLTALLRSQHVSIAIVHWLQNDRSIALSEDTGDSLRLDLLTPDVINTLVSDFVSQQSAGGPVTPQVVDGATGLQIVTVQPIGPMGATTPSAYLILGRQLNPALFHNALTQDVSFTAPTQPLPPNALMINDISGNALAAVTWQPDTPGSALMNRAVLPLGLAMVLFLALSLAIMRAARRGVNALVASEARSNAAARSDTLTGLPNRMHFGERVARLEEKAAQEIAVVVLDINGFKRINESAGHDAGDELVQTLASRLQAVLPKKGFLARVGGDEFRALFSGDNAAAYLEHFLMHVEEVCNAAFQVQDHTFQVNLAIGFATGNTETVEASEIVRRADLAMYEAKNLRSGTPVGFHDGIMQDQGQKQVIENALRASLQTPDDFQIFYQPIISASSGKMHRAEALLRWKSATLGRVSPERFIPIAESSGLIIALGKLIMKRVCADLATWNDLRVSINLSPVQLLDPNFLDDTDRIIRTANIAPKRIEFELTEGLVVDDPDRAGKILKSLRAQGHTISLDDFGTGFSSIGYLRRMSFDKLKVDKRFVSELGGSRKADELLKSLQLLSRSMNLSIVAEGVETETQYETLYALGYDYVQGYYSGRAMPFDDLFSIFPGRNMMEVDEDLAQSA